MSFNLPQFPNTFLNVIYFESLCTRADVISLVALRNYYQEMPFLLTVYVWGLGKNNLGVYLICANTAQGECAREDWFYILFWPVTYFGHLSLRCENKSIQTSFPISASRTSKVLKCAYVLIRPDRNTGAASQTNYCRYAWLQLFDLICWRSKFMHIIR